MANITKKSKNVTRLQILVDVALNAIYNDAIDREEETITNEISFLHKEEEVGTIKYVVHKKILAQGNGWSWDYPPTADEVEFRIEEASIEVFGQNGDVLKNVTSLANQMLEKKVGKILEY
jgi:hypothetical protein